MSDTLLDLANHWQQHLQLILPVAGAIILVVVVYLCSLGSASPQPILADESVSTKKEKALAKKKLKQQSRKQRPANGCVEPVRSQPSTQLDEVKAKAPTEVKKATKAQEKKSAAKDKTPVAPVKDAKIEGALAASRKERAQMKKDALQGEWVTVVSGKEKKAKQTQIVAEESERLSEQARQAIIEEAKRLTAEAEANNKAADAKSSNKSKTDSSTSAGDKSSKSSKAKSSKKSGMKSENSLSSNIPESISTAPSIPQLDVRPKEPKGTKSNVAPLEVTTLTAAPDGDKSLQEKIAEAMQPAFDEMGDWEEAKPQKMKNVKKRARRDK